MFEVPSLSASEQSSVAELARARQVMAAMQLLHKISGIELRDAKAVEMHITRSHGICHWCSGPLEGAGQTECPKCGSLNFDW